MKELIQEILAKNTPRRREMLKAKDPLLPGLSWDAQKALLAEYGLALALYNVSGIRDRLIQSLRQFVEFNGEYGDQALTLRATLAYSEHVHLLIEQHDRECAQLPALLQNATGGDPDFLEDDRGSIDERQSCSGNMRLATHHAFETALSIYKRTPSLKGAVLDAVLTYIEKNRYEAGAKERELVVRNRLIFAMAVNGALDVERKLKNR